MNPAAQRLLVRAGLAAAVLALVLADGALQRRRTQSREEGSRRIGRLVPAAERDALLVAAVSVRTPQGDDLLYGRLEGLWRCLDHHQALADAAALTQIVDQLLAAEGVVASDDPARAAGYGLQDGVAWTVRLHGAQVLAAPDRDVQLAVEIGVAVPGLDGSYVRRVGETSIWAVDVDPRPLLEAGGSPPLLDRHVLPTPWPPDGQVLRRIAVERGDGDDFVMAVRQVEPALEELAPGASPYRWFVQRPDGGEREANRLLSASFVNYLRLAEFAEVLPSGAQAEEAFQQLTGRVAIESSAGETLLLLFGAPRADGRVPVFVPWSATVVAVEPDVAGLLLPASTDLLERIDNPWQPALERGAAAMPVPGGR